MGKLTINKTRSVKGNRLHQATEIIFSPLDDSFLVDLQEFSPNLHAFRVKDFAHDLRCEMVLEVKESLVCGEDESEEGVYLAPVVAGSLPSINLQKLNNKTGFDSYLQGVLMLQFHLKILEQLLLFCEQKRAVSLILTLPDDMLNYVDTFNRFFVSEERVATSNGEQTRIVMPMDVHTYDEIIEFMDELDQDLRKILWRGQKANQAFRQYLTSNACL